MMKGCIEEWSFYIHFWSLFSSSVLWFEMRSEGKISNEDWSFIMFQPILLKPMAKCFSLNGFSVALRGFRRTVSEKKFLLSFRKLIKCTNFPFHRFPYICLKIMEKNNWKKQNVYLKWLIYLRNISCWERKAWMAYGKLLRYNESFIFVSSL